MARADYIETIEKHEGKSFICITDMNVGNMSVTNNIEEVVAEIERRHRIDANSYIIIYCDSELFWDGWDNQAQSFYTIGCVDKNIAIKKCLEKFTKL